MMSGDTRNAMVVAILLSGLLLQCSPAQSKIYYVGDSAGWDFGSGRWEVGKSFKAGDTLVFKYVRGSHNVAVVDKSSYVSCTAPPKAKLYESGNDRITLKKGPNYFICTFEDHCEFEGMKIAAYAT